MCRRILPLAYGVLEIWLGVVLQLHHAKISRVLCPLFRHTRDLATRTVYSTRVRQWRGWSALREVLRQWFTIGFVVGILRTARPLPHSVKVSKEFKVFSATWSSLLASKHWYGHATFAVLVLVQEKEPEIRLHARLEVCINSVKGTQCAWNL